MVKKNQRKWYDVVHGLSDNLYLSFISKISLSLMFIPQVELQGDSHFKLPPHRTVGEAQENRLWPKLMCFSTEDV